MCTPFRNPALLAKMASTLDEISGGRLILGLGAGWHQPEFDAFGYRFDIAEAASRRRWRSSTHSCVTGRVDFHGAYYKRT